MKKLLFLFLAAVLSATAVNAQEATRNGKVTLKTGSVIEGSVQTQGNDVIVTNAAGDVFYFTKSEISKISLDDGTSDSRSSSSVPAGKSGFKAFRKDAKAAYREAKIFGNDVCQFWGENAKAQHYYEKHRKLNRASWITATTGAAFVAVAGPVLFIAYDYGWCYYDKSWTDEYGNYHSEHVDDEYIFGLSMASFAVGGACLITACILPIVAKNNLKRSWQYYDRYGRNHALNISAAPVVYAQGGAGIGISLKF